MDEYFLKKGDVEFSKMTNGLLTGSRTKVVNPGVNDGFEREWINNVFFYDRYSRLVQEHTQNPWNAQGQLLGWHTVGWDYSVSGITYDANGNILSLKQNAPKFYDPPELMDDLTYYYTAGYNQLERVEDAATYHTGRDFKDNNVGSTDYTYDQNGNLKSDKNKGIDKIVYNHLNLPVSVETDAGDVIRNVYDASGNLLQKTITPSGGTPEVYRYWGPFTYRDDQLLYFLHEEGRCRWQADSNQFKYDYFVKDHLGNVRSVVTADLTNPGNYAASHELSKAVAENLVFGGIDETREPLPPNVPPPFGDTTNQYVIELEGSDPDRRVGTSLLLQVMAGDRFQVESLAFYGEPEDEDENVYTDDNSMLNAIFTSFVNGFNPAYAEEGWGAYEQLGQFFGNAGNMTAWNALKELETDPDRPRAYVNYMVFDNNMELVQDQSGVLQVGGTSGVWERLKVSGTDIAIQQNGYIAIFLSNEQFRKVWFDNLWLVHYRGRLIEEHHYYPHGLTLGDVVAAGHEPNPYLHQTKKLQKEAGLMLYDFHARQYDPQIGRFWGIDPMDQFPSGYTGMGNDPANLVDPTGMVVENPPGSYSGTSPIVSSGYSQHTSVFYVKLSDGTEMYIDPNSLMLGVNGDGAGGGGGGNGREGGSGGDKTPSKSGGVGLLSKMDNMVNNLLAPFASWLQNGPVGDRFFEMDAALKQKGGDPFEGDAGYRKNGLPVMKATLAFLTTGLGSAITGPGLIATGNTLFAADNLLHVATNGSFSGAALAGQVPHGNFLYNSTSVYFGGRGMINSGVGFIRKPSQLNFINHATDQTIFFNYSLPNSYPYIINYKKK